MKRSASILSVLGLSLLVSACASMDTILLTNEKLPPNKSVDEVAVLDQKPTRLSLEIAVLRIGDSWLSFGSLQHRILSQVETLGADGNSASNNGSYSVIIWSSHATASSEHLGSRNRKSSCSSNGDCTSSST